MRTPLRSALGIPSTGNDPAHLLRAGAVKSRRTPLRSALALFKFMVMTQRTCRELALFSLGALRSGARLAYSPHRYRKEPKEG